ncbi:MAG: DUF308 domain-containing protein [Sumerlaeia bacterium]
MTFALQRIWMLFVIIGCIHVLFGALCFGLPMAMPSAIEPLLGVLFILTGALQIAYALKSRELGGLVISMLSALVVILFGATILVHPTSQYWTATTLVGLYLTLNGIITLMLAIRLRQRAPWIWLLLSGVVSLILATLIWMVLAMQPLATIAALVGINSLFMGFSTIMFGYAAKAGTADSPATLEAVGKLNEGGERPREA